MLLKSDGDGKPSIRSLLNDGLFWQLSDGDLVLQVKEEFAWALSHLCNATPSVEVGDVKAKGNVGDNRDLSPSRLLYGTDFPEVNRTLVSILALKWILVDDFATFVEHQRADTQLSRASWQKLRNYFNRYASNDKDAYALLVATMVGDVGKDVSLGATISSITGEAMSPSNHDQLALRASAAGIMSPLDCLDGEDREDTIKGLELAAKLNLPQLAQGENVPGSITPILTLRNYRRALDLKIAEIILDVAGAAGHSDSRSAIAFSEPVFQAYSALVDALQSFMNGNIRTEIDCYDRVLQSRASLLHDLGYRQLSTSIASDRALLRVLLIGRVAEKHLAEIFERAFSNLDPKESKLLVLHLNATGLSAENPAVIPYYAPALCTIILRNLKDNVSLLTRALTAFLRFLSRACNPDGVDLKPGEFIYDRDLSFTKEFLESEAFQQNPDSLDTISFR